MTALLKLLLIALPWLAALTGHAAPRVPADDTDVLERLPLRLRDASAEQLRSAAAAAPSDPAAAALLARRYFALAMAEGDPRYVGYAQHDPKNAEARAWRAAIFMVRADYPAAERE